MDRLWKQEDIIQFLRDQATELRPDINWAPVTPQSDLFIGLYGQVLYRLVLVLQYIKGISALGFAEDLLSDEPLLNEIADALGISRGDLDVLLEYDLSALAELYGFGPRKGRKAKTMLRIYFYASGSWVVENMWFVSTDGKRFKPVDEIIGVSVPTIDPIEEEEEVSDYFSRGIPPLSYPYIEIMVEAEMEGSAYNLPAGSIVTVEGTIDGLQSIRNPWDIRNGRDTESLLDYVRRLRAYSSYGRFSLMWLKSYLEENFAFDDVQIRTVGDTGFERPYGADIWVIPEELYATMPLHVNADELITTGLPVNIKPPVSCAEATVLNQSYDDSHFYAYSQLANDRIQWESIPHADLAHVVVDLSVSGAQRALHSFENWLIGPEYALLIRVAQKILVEFEIEMYILEGYLLADVRSSVQDAVENYLKTLKIGESLQASEVVAIIQAVDGVDYVELSSFKMKREDTGESSSDVLSPSFYEYFRFSKITWL